MQDISDGLIGLFGTVGSATIKNLTVRGDIELYSEMIKDENDMIQNGYACAGIVAHSGGHTTIENCESYVNIDASRNDTDAMLAGIIAASMLNDGGSGNKVTITNCKNYGNITCNNEASKAGMAVAAGISCINDYHFVIDGCENYGNVIAYGNADAEVYYGEIFAMEW